MSERYTRLFSLPENLYSVGAPVVIAAGALLKDNQTGKVLAQLKIQNISDKAVKAATVSIAPMDTVGKPLGEAVSYQYLDLNAGRDAEFGQKSPVALPDAATRAFSASVSEVIFVDNTVWTASETVWEPLSAPVSLEQAFDDKELVTQYRIKYGENCKCIFKREKDLWRCACGALNHENERLCHKCQKEAAVLAALDLDDLKASKDKRLEIAKQKAAEEKAVAEAKSKKNRKLAMIIAPIVVAAIVAGVLVSGSMQKSAAYDEAVALMEAGHYEEAITAFEALGNYKDSVEMVGAAQNNIAESQYLHALSLIDNGEYEQAKDEFLLLAAENYKDSADIAGTLNQELQVYHNLLEGSPDWVDNYDATMEMAKSAIANNKYINYDDEYVNAINLISSIVGDWEYVSGDPKVLYYHAAPYHPEYYRECTLLEITMGGGTSALDYVILDIYDNGGNEPPMNHHNTDIINLEENCFSHEYDNGGYKLYPSSDGTLQIVYTFNDGTTASCEYRRVE